MRPGTAEHTASACIAENGSRNGASCRSGFCPSGVLSSSAVSVHDLPEATRTSRFNPNERYHDGLGIERLPAPQKQRADTAGKQVPADKKGDPKAALFTDIALLR